MAERRTAARLRSLLRGRIVFNNGNSTLDCTVREISSDGARLEVSEAVTIPDRFDLFIPQKNQTSHAVIVWRRENSIGVTFERDEVQIELGTSADTLARLRLLEADIVELRRLVAGLQAEVRQLAAREAAI
jgi:hypothetical protein